MRNSILVMLVVFGSAIASLKRQFVGFITISWFRRQATSADQLDQEKRTAREPRNAAAGIRRIAGWLFIACLRWSAAAVRRSGASPKPGLLLGFIDSILWQRLSHLRAALTIWNVPPRSPIECTKRSNQISLLGLRGFWGLYA
jgi:hypothetical protein